MAGRSEGWAHCRIRQAHRLSFLLIKIQSHLKLSKRVTYPIEDILAFERN